MRKIFSERWPVKFLAAAFAATLALLAPAAAAAAGSLWQEAEENSMSSGLFSEVKGHKIGDILTVLIIENSTATHKATTQTKKSNNLSVKAGTGPLNFIPGMGNTASSDFQGDGTTSQSGNLTAKVSAKIIRKLPNGNLVIEGKRTVRINEENQEITLTGTVRPTDIAADNTVLSSYLADASIRYKGNGVNNAANRRGVLKRVSDFVF